ncbi:MAG: thiamine pyrophosphate-dependent enzyme [Anaerolineae bacterium]|nr:thiamine pyrophosphate-dependent enzyme [Anaerolineae bacterium]MDW8067771.1 thiamine pyrophosphate-dependent enzyme [Anaerolineae bacterium]
MSRFLIKPELPYCKGCGHHLIVRNTVKALEALGASPLDVVLVTDIGCHGIVDGNFATHTVHGLHGRSVALAAGIAMGLPPEKKVIVYIGDGGATIGLQHILEAARMNVDLTVVVHNNMLYGMTGGQPSGLTPTGFRTVLTPQGYPLPHHDLPRLVLDAGAPFAARVVGLGDFSDVLRQALEVEGFALVEVLEICVSYGVKMNPDLGLRPDAQTGLGGANPGPRLRELARETGYEPGVWTGPTRPAFRPARRETASLLDMPPVLPKHSSPLAGRMTLILAGSAGEGVQQAAELLAQAAIAAGLYATKKSMYPVTVGVGFSTAEIVLSRSPIFYHGVSEPDVMVVTSADGLENQRKRIDQMRGGILWLDASLPVPETGAEVRITDFRGRAGARNAALYALLTILRATGVVPPEAFLEAVAESPIGRHIDPSRW